MKHLLIVILLIFSICKVSASIPKNYKVHIVTWDNSRVTGRLEGITDSSISIRIHNGKLFTFSAEQTKNLKIWKSGIKLPFTIATVVASVFLVKALVKNDALDPVARLYIIPLSTAPGLVVGDLLSTRFNERRMRVIDFSALQTTLK
ncbi:MAG: hypothetical protein JWN56_579 [Sphingobacteriales bacterium]|nr:hypothetical protein [Sphingobacteriales bacterium]